MKEITNETEFQEYINQELRDLNIPYIHRKSSKGGHYVTSNTIIINDIKMRWLDLIIFLPEGRVIHIELKWGYDKPSKEQKNMIEWLVDNGSPVYVIRSLQEWNMIKQIEKIG